MSTAEQQPTKKGSNAKTTAGSSKNPSKDKTSGVPVISPLPLGSTPTGPQMFVRPGGSRGGGSGTSDDEGPTLGGPKSKSPVLDENDSSADTAVESSGSPRYAQSATVGVFGNNAGRNAVGGGNAGTGRMANQGVRHITRIDDEYQIFTDGRRTLTGEDNVIIERIKRVAVKAARGTQINTPLVSFRGIYVEVDVDCDICEHIKELFPENQPGASDIVDGVPVIRSANDRLVRVGIGMLPIQIIEEAFSSQEQRDLLRVTPIGVLNCALLSAVYTDDTGYGTGACRSMYVFDGTARGWKPLPVTFGASMPLHLPRGVDMPPMRSMGRRMQFVIDN